MNRIDITLAAKILKEDKDAIFDDYTRVTLREQPRMATQERDCTKGFSFYPGQIIFVTPEQDIPPGTHEFKLSRDLVKLGISSLIASDDHGLTLVLMNCTNNHVIKLHKGDHLGQLVIA